jgi:hypothetical protein
MTAYKPIRYAYAKGPVVESLVLIGGTYPVREFLKEHNFKFTPAEDGKEAAWTCVEYNRDRYASILNFIHYVHGIEIYSQSDVPDYQVPGFGPKPV